MSAHEPVDRDERTVAVENAAFRWAYLLLTYALLIDVAARSLLRHEQSWDLLGLVVIGGILMAACQARHGLLQRKWALAVGASVVVGALAAMLMLVFR